MRRSRILTTAAGCVLVLGGCSGAAQHRLPAGFPAAVPVIGGAVLASDHDEFEWHLWIAAKDPLAAYRAARRALLRHGYSETADTESRSGSDGQFCDPTWCAEITGYHDPRHGDSVMYSVARTSGLGPPLPLAG